MLARMKLASAAGLVVAGVALVMLGGGVVVLVVDFFTGGRSAQVVTAGASLAMAGATIGLLVGSFLAAWYLRLQVREAARLSEAALREAQHTREALLRPALIFPDLRGGSLNVRPGEDDEFSLQLRNVGAGPALDVRVLAWDRHNYDGSPLGRDEDGLKGAPPTHRSGPDMLGPGDSIEVLLWATNSRRAEGSRPSGPLHLRITCVDVFGNAFSTPAEGEPPLGARFVRRPV